MPFWNLLTHPYCHLTIKPTDSLDSSILIKSPIHERWWIKTVFWKKCLCGRSFLSMWCDIVPVCTSSYLKGMHWRDLHGEKVTQVTSEAKCLDCVRAPLAMRRSSTLPCLSSSQLGWMRPAGTAPLSDNCNSSLCPPTPLASRPGPSGLQAWLITHIIQSCAVAREQPAHFTTSVASIVYSRHAAS